MIRLAKTSSLLAVPLAALAIAGCGGGGGDSTSTAATTETTVALTKADLITQGDALCAEVNKAVGGLAFSGAEVPEQITQTADLYTGMVESIKGLGAPEDAAGYPEFIAAAEELSKVEGEVKLAAEREDTAALGEAASAAAPALEEFETVAGEYGFEECSEGPSTPTAGVPARGRPKKSKKAASKRLRKRSKKKRRSRKWRRKKSLRKRAAPVAASKKRHPKPVAARLAAAPGASVRADLGVKLGRGGGASRLLTFLLWSQRLSLS